jgi:hypothetical protein
MNGKQRTKYSTNDFVDSLIKVTIYLILRINNITAITAKISVGIIYSLKLNTICHHKLN